MTDRPPRVLLAAPRGYCAGVDRAVITVEKALETYGAPVYVRKQIVHNKHVVETLQDRGAIFVEENDEVPEGATVIFSAHGVAPVVHEQAAPRQLKTIDATCPLVTKVHHEARRFAADDYDILLIGHEGHEEVVGTTGEAPDHIHLVDGPDGVDDVVVRDPEKVAWLSQTTLSVDETLETVRRLRERFPALLDPPSDDICYATQNRQVAVKEIAADADLVIVVGSTQLVELGAPGRGRARVRRHGRPAWSTRPPSSTRPGSTACTTVGVTSGASVPEILVRGVLDWLAERGYADVEEVVSAEESLLFALPPELRRDMKAAAVPAEAGRRLPVVRPGGGRRRRRPARPGRRRPPSSTRTSSSWSRSSASKVGEAFALHTASTPPGRSAASTGPARPSRVEPGVGVGHRPVGAVVDVEAHDVVRRRVLATQVVGDVGDHDVHPRVGQGVDGEVGAGGCGARRPASARSRRRRWW